MSLQNKLNYMSVSYRDEAAHVALFNTKSNCRKPNNLLENLAEQAGT